MNLRVIPLVLLFGLLALEGRAAGTAPKDILIMDDFPQLRTWVQPVYPPQALKDKVEGTVMVRLIVDTGGRVESARVLEPVDPQLDEAALAAVRTWIFTPALEEGRPVKGSLDVPVKFAVAATKKKSKPQFLPPFELMPQPSPRTAAEEKDTPEGEYPGILTERKIQGAVTFAGEVNVEGRVVAPRITGATHVEFVLPALQALERWEFTPAKQGDLPAKSSIETKISFVSLANSREEVLAANGLSAPDGNAPPLAPEPYIVVDPVWPCDLLLAGKGGSAAAEFTVSANGSVSAVKLREATAPQYGHALVAALESWGFHPALEGGLGVAVPMLLRMEFKAVPAGQESESNPVERVLAALRAKEIGPPKDLDEKLTPIYRPPPAYPAVFSEGKSPAGEARIEFVIDRDGRARLPRIVSATREEFGWSAATAVSQWVFKAPRKGGHPVDVIVQIPIEFAAPEK